MATQDFKRRLTAIFSADVEGYSRLMREDEEATVRTITAYREVVAAVVQKHRGRVVDSPGDNILAEFPSVVDAIQSSVSIQKELAARNAELRAHCIASLGKDDLRLAPVVWHHSDIADPHAVSEAGTHSFNDRLLGRESHREKSGRSLRLLE